MSYIERVSSNILFREKPLLNIIFENFAMGGFYTLTTGAVDLLFGTQFSQMLAFQISTGTGFLTVCKGAIKGKNHQKEITKEIEKQQVRTELSLEEATIILDREKEKDRKRQKKTEK
ncbi:hypothetical protein HYX13_04935 [Candidatus Woesearchaeota archaeon]|nr:hypothetical protein [Candidatus Woesearchaeota archaeon]